MNKVVWCERSNHGTECCIGGGLKGNCTAEATTYIGGGCTRCEAHRWDRAPNILAAPPELLVERDAHLGTVIAGGGLESYVGTTIAEEKGPPTP